MVLAATRRSQSVEMGVKQDFVSFLSLRAPRLREILSVFGFRASGPLPDTFLGLLRSSIVRAAYSHGSQPCPSDMSCAG
jgi:hypothetical protein